MIHFARLLARDCRGGALIEFALLSPLLITTMVGVFEVGMHLYQHNAIRNLAADGARNAVVQYQRGVEMTTEEVELDVTARGIGPRYALLADRLEVDVDQPATRIAGVREMTISIEYSAPTYISSLFDLDALTIRYARPVFLLIPAA